MSKIESSEFETQSQQARQSWLAEFWDFIKHNKKWWLVPILIVFGLLGLLILAGSTGVGPFIYPLL